MMTTNEHALAVVLEALKVLTELRDELRQTATGELPTVPRCTQVRVDCGGSKEHWVVVRRPSS